VNASLFDARGSLVMADAVSWLNGTLLGSVALGLCVVGVGMVGAMMLSGRLAVREGLRVLIGCFVLLGAPSIAASFQLLVDASGSAPPEAVLPSTAPAKPARNLPESNYDPYAGASLRDDRRD